MKSAMATHKCSKSAESQQSHCKPPFYKFIQKAKLAHVLFLLCGQALGLFGGLTIENMQSQVIKRKM